MNRSCAPVSRAVLFLLGLIGFGLFVGPFEAQRYHVRTYDETDGLPSPAVRGLIQDRDGKIWLGTRRGVATYDGRSWTRTTQADGLPADDTGSLFLAPDGAVWSLSARTPARLARFDGTRWHAFPPGPSEGVEDLSPHAAIAFDGDRVWALVGDAQGILSLWDGESWAPIDGFRTPSRSRIRTIVADDDGFLVGTRDGLLRLDPKAPSGGPRPLAGFPRQGVMGLARESGTKRWWVVGESWVGLWEKSSLQLLAESLEFGMLDFVEPLSMAPDGRGGLYLGSPYRMFHFDPNGGLEKLDRGSGLIGDGATAMMLDREQNLWVAGMRGVTKLISRRFAGYDSEHGLWDDEVTAILERRSGAMVLGHPGGLTWFEDPMRTLSISTDVMRGRVTDLAEDADRTLWAAVAWEGLLAIDRQGKRRWYREQSGLELPVNAVMVDRQGTLWTCTGSRLMRRRGDRFEEVRLARTDPGPGPHLRRLFQSADGRIWIASRRHGLFNVDGDRTGRFAALDSAAANNVYAIHERPDGTIWAGTEAGLFRVGARSLVRTAMPRIDRPIYFIVPHDDGSTWLGTDNGVRIWDGIDLRVLTMQQGLIGNETNRAGGRVDSQGRMWIGTDRGLSIYRPDLDRPRPVPPTIPFIELASEQDPSAAASNRLSFRFGAISFVDEERVRFQHRLEGYDDDWREAEEIPNRLLSYAALAPGRYRLHLRAVDVDGRVGPTATSSEVIVHGPLWQHRGFLVGSAIALGLLLFGAMAFLWQRRAASRLEAEVRRRTAELRSSRRAIASEKDRLQVTLASLAEGVAALDTAGIIALWNPAAERILGVWATEAIGRPIADLIPGINEVRDSDGDGSTRRRAHHPREGLRLLELSFAPLAGSTPGRVVAFRDVSDRDRLETELARAQRLEALGVLAGGLAHDFNNLLMVVVGQLSLIENDDALSQGTRGKVEDAQRASLKAWGLTRELLTFARGGHPIRSEEAIEPLIRQVLQRLDLPAEVTLIVDVADELWPIEIDEVQIKQVLRNLLSHSTRAIKGRGTIRIRARRLQEAPSTLAPGRCVAIEVSHDGQAIPVERLAQVFDPYETLSVEGGGLGLAAAHSIVRRHDGLLTVSSDGTHGSTFRIVLPVPATTVAEEPASVEAERTPMARAESTGLRVLVMDDESGVRAVIRDILEFHGYETETSTNGADAIWAYEVALRRGRRFDLVLLDLLVPGGTGGVETARRIVELDADACAVAMTGYTDDPVLSRYSESGFRGSIAKPFEASRLIELVRAAIASGRPGEEPDRPSPEFSSRTS